MPLWGKGKKFILKKTDGRLASKPQECLSARRNSLDILSVRKRKEKISGFEVLIFRCQNEKKYFDLSELNICI